MCCHIAFAMPCHAMPCHVCFCLSQPIASRHPTPDLHHSSSVATTCSSHLALSFVLLVLGARGSSLRIPYLMAPKGKKAAPKPKAKPLVKKVATFVAKPKVAPGKETTLLEEEAAKNHWKKKGRANDDEKAAVMKLLNDHFRCLTTNEKFVKRIDGITLRDKLTRDRLKWLSGELEMGKYYYLNNRNMYSNEDAPQKKIVVIDEAESDDDELEEALFQVAKHVPESEMLFLWLARDSVPNQKNAAALMRLLTTFDPYAGPTKNEVFLRVLAWVVEVEFYKKFPDIWKTMLPIFHKALDKSYTLHKADGGSAKTWWISVRDFAYVLLDKDAMVACIAATKNWAKVKDSLVKVKDYPVAQRVFAAGLRHIDGNSFSELIDNGVYELANYDAKITKAFLKEKKDELEATFKERQATLHVTCKPRNIDINYRGVVFPCQVNSYLEEYEMKRHAVLLSIASKREILTPLFCELDLIDKTKPEHAPEMDADVVEKANEARAEVKNKIEDEKTASASDIKECLLMHHRLFSQLDKQWKVTMNFWLSQVGATGEGRLRETALSFFPSAQNAKDLDECNKSIKALLKGKLYQFVSVALQTELTTISEWVSNMAVGRNPGLPTSTCEGSIYKDVVDRLPFFARIAGLGDKVGKHGRDAVVAWLTDVEKKTRKLLLM